MGVALRKRLELYFPCPRPFRQKLSIVLPVRGLRFPVFHIQYPANKPVHITSGVDRSTIADKYYEPPLMQVIPSGCDGGGRGVLLRHTDKPLYICRILYISAGL